LAGLLVAAGSAASGASPDAAERYEFTQLRMGSQFKLALYAPDEASANRAAQAAFDRIEELNGIFSDYDTESEAMRLCRASRAGEPVQVSAELLHVLLHAQTWAERSGGGFDVSVGPIVKLWRRARRQHELPDRKNLDRALQSVGYQHIRIDAAARAVALLKPDMRLDFGGIVKGYAADEALRVLREHGTTRAMLAASGDIVVGALAIRHRESAAGESVSRRLSIQRARRAVTWSSPTPPLRRRAMPFSSWRSAACAIHTSSTRTPDWGSQRAAA
jgi:thiamine biosynthesis lipoprotein